LAWKPSLEREAGVNEVLGANGECEPVDDALGDRREAEEGRESLKAWRSARS
jgi:hypothetical protein